MANVQAQRDFFNTGKTRSLDFRIEQLKRLEKAIKKYEKEILDAFAADFGKPRFEGYLSEIGFCIEEIRHTLKHVRKWARPRKVSTSMVHFYATSAIHLDPLGVALIIAPWNYPFQLLIAPLIAAMAAGNCAVLKPSELTPHTAAVIDKLTRETFEPGYIQTVLGGADETQALLAQRFDHIFFTGGIVVGKIVMAAAAKYLTPVTLELGGKSPCIVDESFPVEMAARRIAWGKFFNAGQTCVAPDYLLVHKSVKARFLEEMKRVLREFYGEDPSQSPDYARIVNSRHFSRLQGLMGEGRVVIGGQSNAETRYIAPTVIDGVSMNSKVMSDEIFGPILPVLEFDKLDEAIATIQQRPYPLALYMFSKDRGNEKRILDEVPFGGGCVNDTLIHLSSTELPFGGVGPSGMGGYHGQNGFDLFSHKKSILKKTAVFDLPVRYPPYSEGKLNWIKKLFY